MFCDDFFVLLRSLDRLPVSSLDSFVLLAAFIEAIISSLLVCHRFLAASEDFSLILGLFDKAFLTAFILFISDSSLRSPPWPPSVRL